MFSYFLSLRDKYKYSEDEIHEMLDNYDIGKLDISRIFRYLDKYMGLESSSTQSRLISNDSKEDANDDDDFFPKEYQKLLN